MKKPPRELDAITKRVLAYRPRDIPPDVREAMAKAGAKAIALHQEEIEALGNRLYQSPSAPSPKSKPRSDPPPD